jgi:hypothetical protein
MEETPAPPPSPPPSQPVVAKPVEKPAEPPAKPQRHPSSTAPKPAKAPAASPEELIGLDESGVRKLLGAPAEIGTAGAARILSYRSVTCTLDVLFFMDLKAGDLRVASYEWDNGGNRPQPAKGCYSELRVTQ